MLLPPATGGAGQAANRGAFIVFDRLSKKRRQEENSIKGPYLPRLCGETQRSGGSFTKPVPNKDRATAQTAPPTPTPPLGKTRPKSRPKTAFLDSL